MSRSSSNSGSDSNDAHSSYRHEALFYAGQDEFSAGTTPFVRRAIAADEPVLVVVLGEPKIAMLRDELGGDARSHLTSRQGRTIPSRSTVAVPAEGARRLSGVAEPATRRSQRDRCDEPAAAGSRTTEA
jgi:hypothetical protein